MKISKELYSEGLSEKQLKKVIKKIKNNRPVLDICVITLPIVHKGLLEIYYYRELMQKAYDSIRDNILVIGITNTREEAINQVVCIVDHIYKETGEFDMKSFFMMLG